jgi:hypothetical protein
MRYFVEPIISAFFKSIFTNLFLISFLKALPGHLSYACIVKKISYANSAMIPGELLRMLA